MIIIEILVQHSCWYTRVWVVTIIEIPVQHNCWYASHVKSIRTQLLAGGFTAKTERLLLSR